MHRLLALVAALSVGFTPATSAGSTVKRHCTKTFTLEQFRRAARSTYRGEGLPPRGSYSHLWRYARCTRPPTTERVARREWAAEKSAWAARRHPPMSYALASWYYDSGTTGCGFHATYGIAALNISCGARVEVCHVGCVVAVRDDSGPYVAGRTFDLGPAVKGAIGCGDLCEVRWRSLP